MYTPNHLRYTKTHEWIEFIDENTARIGITDYAQESLGDLVFVNLPDEGDDILAGESFGDVESVKAVSDIISPVSATVTEVNAELQDDPAQINSDPYGAWFITVTDISDKEELLDADAYAAFVEEEANA